MSSIDLTATSAYTIEPIAWFLSTAPIFILTLKQKPESRWWVLPLNVLPAVQSYRTVDRMSIAFPGLDWLLAFTTLIYIVHATSALYIEQWVLPKSNPESPGLLGDQQWMVSAFRAWMNPRRLPLTPGVQASVVTTSRDTKSLSIKPEAISRDRILFLAKTIATMALLGIMYIGIELGILLVLLPGPRDFGPVNQTYFPDLARKSSPGTRLIFGAAPSGALTHRVAALRSVYALHWAWLTYLILTAAHTFLAIIFVCVIRIDAPSEWPPLFGSPLEAFSVRRVWGRFWHQLGTPSMLAYGRVVTRKILGLRSGSVAEKALLAMWVFAASGLVHALVTGKTGDSVDVGGGGDLAWISSDWWFLMLNFGAGLTEVVLSRIFIGKRGSQGPRRPVHLALRLLGYSWVFAFFWCIVPPYQYPVLERAAQCRLPFRVSMSSNTTLNFQVQSS